MRYELKSLGVWSFVRVSFFVNLVVGFLVGLLYAGLLGMILAAAGSAGDFGDLPFDPSTLGPLLLILVPIFLAIVCAVFNTLLGVVAIVAYNLVAKMAGGIEMELGQAQPTPAGAPTFPVSSSSPPPPATWNPPPPPPSDPPRERGPEQA